MAKTIKRAKPRRSASEAKTKVTTAPVAAFLASVTDDRVRRDCRAIATMMEQATGSAPKLWGKNIVGFGTYRYTYATGKEGDWPIVAFSPRKTNLTLYIAPDFDGRAALLEALGKHSCGASCVYIKRLADVDTAALRRLIAAGVQHTRRKYGTAPRT